MTINCRRYSGNINHETGALSATHQVAANAQPNYGTDKRADDIRAQWPMGHGWNSSRNAIRSGSNGDPGLILISLIDDGSGEIAPVVVTRFTMGASVIRYI